MLQCILCECDETTRLEGFPVCKYHETHDERSPACPVCRNFTNEDPSDDPDLKERSREELGMTYTHGIIEDRFLEDILDIEGFLEEEK